MRPTLTSLFVVAWVLPGSCAVFGDDVACDAQTPCPAGLACAVDGFCRSTGGEGEGEGEGEGDPVVAVRFLVEEPPWAAVEASGAYVYRAIPRVTAVGVDDEGVVVDGAGCALVPTLDLPALTADSTDTVVTATCGANDDDSDDAAATLTLQPLFAAAKPATRGPPRMLSADDLVEHTATASCAVADDAAIARSGQVMVSCTGPDGVTSVDVLVSVYVDVAVRSSTPALFGSSLAVHIDQVAATSCAVQCGDEPETSDGPITDNGLRTIPIVNLPAAPATITCAVTCAGPAPDGQTTATTTFSVRVGDVTSAAALDALPTIDAIVGRLTLDESLGAQTLSTKAEVITGDLTVRDTDDAVNSLFLRFPKLRALGGGLTLDGVDDLPTLQDIDQDDVLDEDGDGVADDFAFPALASVGGALTITGNAALRTVTLPSLANIGGALNISGNTALTAVTFAAHYALGGSPSARDFTIVFNGAEFVCDEISALFRAMTTCPAGTDEAIAADDETSCELTCP